MKNTSPPKSQSIAVADMLLSAGSDPTSKRRAQSALSDYMDGGAGSRPCFGRVRQMMQALGAAAGPAAALDPAATLLSTALSARETPYRDALRWPQVQSLGDRLIRQATDPLDGVLDEFKLDSVYNRASSILPVDWFRLHAGLAVAEALSSDALATYPQSAFCLQAEDRVENFALGPWWLLMRGTQALQPLMASDRTRAARAKTLLLQLHPSIADELEAPEDDGFTTEQWHQAVDQQICRLFDESMVSDAENLFASPCGQQILLQLPRITRMLDTLAQSNAMRSVAEACVHCAMIEQTAVNYPACEQKVA